MSFLKISRDGVSLQLFPPVFTTAEDNNFAETYFPENINSPRILKFSLGTSGHESNLQVNVDPVTSKARAQGLEEATAG